MVKQSAIFKNLSESLRKIGVSSLVLNETITSIGERKSECMVVYLPSTEQSNNAKSICISSAMAYENEGTLLVIHHSISMPQELFFRIGDYRLQKMGPEMIHATPHLYSKPDYGKGRCIERSLDNYRIDLPNDLISPSNMGYLEFEATVFITNTKSEGAELLMKLIEIFEDEVKDYLSLIVFDSMKEALASAETRWFSYLFPGGTP